MKSVPFKTGTLITQYGSGLWVVLRSDEVSITVNIWGLTGVVELILYNSPLKTCTDIFCE